MPFTTICPQLSVAAFVVAHTENSANAVGRRRRIIEPPAPAVQRRWAVLSDSALYSCSHHCQMGTPLRRAGALMPLRLSWRKEQYVSRRHAYRASSADIRRGIVRQRIVGRPFRISLEFALIDAFKLALPLEVGRLIRLASLVGLDVTLRFLDRTSQQELCRGSATRLTWAHRAKREGKGRLQAFAS